MYTISVPIVLSCTALSNLIYFVFTLTSGIWITIYANVSITESYKARIPLDIGLLKCFSEICTDYNAFVRQFSLQQSHIRLDAVEEMDLVEAPFKHASIAVLLGMSVAGFCCVYSLVVTSFHLFHKCSLQAVALNRLIVLLWVISVVLFVGNALYCLLTYQYLNGGFYNLQGVYLMNIVSMINASAAACLSQVAPMEISALQHPYAPIRYV